VANLNKRIPGAATNDLQKVLFGLAGMQLDEDRAVLGNRQNIADATRKAREEAQDEPESIAQQGKAPEHIPLAPKSGALNDAENPLAPRPAHVVEVIDISDGPETGTARPTWITPKAWTLMRLSKKMDSATDNKAISGIILEFVDFLRSGTSRNLTKEGFAFLDALYKQLADPSVFIVPMRTSRSRTASKDPMPLSEEPRNNKLGVVFRLKTDVRNVKSNKELARMVADFGAVTNKSSGRTVTKDGFGFLEGLAARLLMG